MEVLGHSGISVTMNTCAHVLPVLRQEAAEAEHILTASRAVTPADRHAVT
jgi:hypothetical protein